MIQRALIAKLPYRKGFCYILLHIRDCIGAGEVPTPNNVLKNITRGNRKTNRETQRYLKFGGTTQGKVEAAMTVLFTRAESDDEMTGDGSCMDWMSDEVLNLRRCRNDHEFGFVANLLVAAEFAETIQSINLRVS